jgi:putative membrane protein
MDSLFLFFHTFVLRPYVLLFFLVYLLGGSLHLGVKRTLSFSVAGYLIAWLSEFSSIHTGFPYGLYYYIDATKDRELWVAGVPFMDSLSYVFLAYASYAMALFVMSPVLLARGRVYILETRRIRSALKTRVLATVFFVYLDILIDPLALRGSKWFLGQIYGYPAEGAYFGVPISNFLGWFLVGYVLVFVLQKIDSVMARRKVRDNIGYRYAWRYMPGPLLYVSVVLFALIVAFAIGEWSIGWTGVFITLLPVLLISYTSSWKRAHVDVEEAVREHRHDFPHAVVPTIPSHRG